MTAKEDCLPFSHDDGASSDDDEEEDEGEGENEDDEDEGEGECEVESMNDASGPPNPTTPTAVVALKLPSTRRSIVSTTVVPACTGAPFQ